MLSSSDDVPSLAIGCSTLGDLDWGQVGPEVTRELVDREASSVRGLSRLSQPGDDARSEIRTYFDVDIRRSPCGICITLMGLSHGGLVKGVDCPGVDDWVGGGESRRSEERDQLGMHGEGVGWPFGDEYTVCKECLVLRCWETEAMLRCWMMWPR